MLWLPKCKSCAAELTSRIMAIMPGNTFEDGSVEVSCACGEKTTFYGGEGWDYRVLSGDEYSALDNFATTAPSNRIESRIGDILVIPLEKHIDYVGHANISLEISRNEAGDVIPAHGSIDNMSNSDELIILFASPIKGSCGVTVRGHYKIWCLHNIGGIRGIAPWIEQMLRAASAWAKGDVGYSFDDIQSKILEPCFSIGLNVRCWPFAAIHGTANYVR